MHSLMVTLIIIIIIITIIIIIIIVIIIIIIAACQVSTSNIFQMGSLWFHSHDSKFLRFAWVVRACM